MAITNGIRVQFVIDGEVVESIGVEQQTDPARPGKTPAELVHHNAQLLAANNGYHNWTATVANPDFDAGQPASEENSETIPNPVTYMQAAAFALGTFGRKVIQGALRQAARVPVQEQIDQAVAASDAAAQTVIE